MAHLDDIACGDDDIKNFFGELHCLDPLFEVGRYFIFMAGIRVDDVPVCVLGHVCADRWGCCGLRIVHRTI